MNNFNKPLHIYNKYVVNMQSREWRTLFPRFIFSSLKKNTLLRREVQRRQRKERPKTSRSKEFHQKNVYD